MSFAWMRRIDAWVGKPAMWVLSLFTPRARSLCGDGPLEKIPRKVIVTKFLGLGSVVLSLPLLRALKEAGVEIAFWSFAGQADLVKFSGYVDQVWIIRPTARDFLPTLWKSWRAARAFKANAILDLEPTANFTAILSRLCGAPIRVGFMSAKPLRESLFTHLVSLTAERHMVENNLLAGRVIGVSPLAVTDLPPSPAEVVQLDSPIVRVAGRKLVVINVNTSDLSWHRSWPENSWTALCRELLKDPTIDLVFTGSPSERPRVENQIAKITEDGSVPRGRIYDIAGKTSLVQLLKLLKDAHLVVSVDSGVMHLAGWMGSPLVGLFGPETPRLFAPRSPNARVLWASLPCSPCLSVAADKITRCQDNQCMKRISADRVYLACRAFLEVYAIEEASAARPKTAAVRRTG